ncbi:MAG: hypothetical protein ABEI52_12165, partial [Halobacteriaceae archaeon]
MSIRQGFMIGHGIDHVEALSFASRHDFDFVELDLEQGIPPQQFDVEAVRQELDGHEFDVIAHLPYRLDLGSP